MTTAFARELAIERAEARLAGVLDEHGAAVVAAARTGRAAPPWPDAVARIEVPVVEHDASWAARARTLGRWRLAARLAGDPAVAAAAAGPASLDGLAARYRALAPAAARLGLVDAAAVAAARFGAAPRRSAARFDDDGGVAGPEEPRGALPSWRTVGAALAERAGVPLEHVVVCDDGHAAVTVVTTSAVVCVFPAVRDLASLQVAAHELGHGLYAAAMRGLPLGLAAAPARWFDEAVAAWAVRALEEVAPLWAARARWRRARAEAARAALAAAEAAALAGADLAVAWPHHVGRWRPSLAAAVLAEPGVAAAYAAADAARLAPGRGAIAAWAAVGAALEPTAVGVALEPAAVGVASVAAAAGDDASDDAGSDRPVASP